MSAPRVGPLPSIFSLDPGTERHERRGRFFVRSDMPGRLRQVARALPTRQNGPMARHRGPARVVARLVGAIETGDLDSCGRCTRRAPSSGPASTTATRDVDSSMGVLEWLVGATTERHYDVTRRVEIDGGVLQQHVLHATTKNGQDVLDARVPRDPASTATASRASTSTSIRSRSRPRSDDVARAAGRRDLRVDPARRRVGGEQRGGRRRRRRAHDHRHADGALAVGAVRRGGRRARACR